MNIRALATSLALICSLSACTKVGGQATDGRANSFTHPHILRISMDEDIPTLNPWFSQTAAVNDVAEMTMAYLFRYNNKNETVPELATVVPTRGNGGISADGKTITYHLREHVAWSDGAPFNADDLVFSFKQYLNKDNNVVDRNGWDLITSIQKINPYTVKIVLRKPYSVFESTFFSGGGVCILPKHLLGKEKSLNRVAYNSMPIGIGPFRIAEWKRAEQIALEPNPTYWRGKPKLTRVEFHVLPKRNTVLEQMQTGNIDLWIPAPSYFIDRLKALSGYTVSMQPSYTFSHIDFNTSHPALSDARVRTALRFALQRKLIRDKISHGIGILQESPLSPSYPNAPPIVPLIEPDHDAAVDLLEKAGWKVGANGIRQKNGKELRFDVAMGTPEVDSDAMIELIRGWWQDIGVAIDVKHYDTKLFFAQYNDGGIINKGKYDVTMFSWQLTPFDSMHSILACDAVPPYGQNNTRYCNPAADKLMEAFDRTYDKAEQRRIKGELIKIFVRDAPMIVTAVRETIWVANNDLKDFHPGASSSFGDMLNVDI